MVSPAGFEPAAPGLGILCSILLSYEDTWGERISRPPTEFQVIAYQDPVLPIDAQGSAFGRASPRCSSSIEILSGERTKAM